MQFLDILLHLNEHLSSWAESMGPWLYVVLFLIVFCETGLVVTPFLPGDSLLFATGTLCALGVMNLGLVLVLLLVAAIVGDAVNYAIGRHIGPRIFVSETSIWLNKKHLLRTQRFYERHGGKTIIIARFAPILRTFAPFVAGIGQMRYRRFAAFNVVGGAAWVVSFLLAGYWFGNQPVVQRNFHVVIVAIIVISLIPAVVEFMRQRREERRSRAAA
jgi:membrane-associated protein